MEKFIHVDRCDSTQELLKEQLTQYPNDDFTISCEFQEKGKGRGNNHWLDSAGTLCFSINIIPHSKMSFTALELSVLISKFFETEGQITKLKWPNDLLNKESKKCGGILIQNSSSHYLAGIGLDLFIDSKEFGGIYKSPFDLDKQSWVKTISKYIRSNRYEDTDVLIKDWNERCVHLGQKVKITEGKTEHYGVFQGLGEDGEAVILNDQGLHHLYNGSLYLV